MDNIHDDGHAVAMRLVYQFLQFLGRTKTAARRKEGTDMIAKGSIVGMLLDGHDLDGIIAISDDTRQHLLAKLAIGTHLLLVLRHSDMALIDQERLRLRRQRLRHPTVRRLGRPHLCREDMRRIILHHAVGPGRYTLAFSTIPLDVHLIKLSVAQGVGRKREQPVVRVLDPTASVGLLLLPRTEVADEINVRGMGSPLSEHPPRIRPMQTEILIAIRKVGERLLAVARQLVYLPQGVVVATPYRLLIRLQIGVVAHNADVLHYMGFYLCGSSRNLFAVRFFVYILLVHHILSIQSFYISILLPSS